MSLDLRANHAVRSLQESTARIAPLPLDTVVGRRRRRSATLGLVGALAIAVGSVALATVLTQVPDEGAPSAVTTLPLPDDLIGIPTGDPGTTPSDPGVQQHNAVSASPSPYTFFTGTADPGTVVSATSAHGSADLVVGSSGAFQLKVWFVDPPSGESFPVVLMVGDVAHDFSFTWVWDPSAVALTALQMYGSSSSDTPYEKFFGTAPPGTAITAISAYGTAAVDSDSKGDWHLKVWFTGAPAGVAFPVTVTVGDQAFAFEFVAHFAAEPVAAVAVFQDGTSSSSSSPYTRFYGTAAPGTVVQATSQYGSGNLTVGDSGEFSLKVWFSGSPNGVKFPVTVKLDGTVHGTYYFTWHQAAPVSFTLTQYNTESWDISPWVKFYGSAQPGTQISASSAYGSASTTADSKGEYLLKLWFSSLPPAGSKFPVTVKVNGSTYGTYDFTSWFSGTTTTVTPVITEAWDANPYAKVEYWAPAGTKIDLVSDYGSASITTGSTGGGHLKLMFSSLPPKGVPITVTIKVNGSTHGSFSFTSWYDPGTIAKTANFTFGTCSENPPWDKYYGTAPAGTSVTITSPYGGASTTADGNGHWNKKVTFSGAPLNEAFTVTVNVGGEIFYFGMVVTGS